MISMPSAGWSNGTWNCAAPADEAVSTPVEEHLQSRGEALLVDWPSGQRHLIYPAQHALTEAAEQTGREHLIAAWLYLHFRMRAGDGGDESLANRYQTLTGKLFDLLADAGDQADADFVDSIERWQADGPGQPIPPDGVRA